MSPFVSPFVSHRQPCEPLAPADAGAAWGGTAAAAPDNLHAGEDGGDAAGGDFGGRGHLAVAVGGAGLAEQTALPGVRQLQARLRADHGTALLPTDAAFVAEQAEACWLAHRA